MPRFVLLGGSYVNASAILVVQPTGPDSCQLHLVGVPIGHSPHGPVHESAEKVVRKLSDADADADE